MSRAALSVERVQYNHQDSTVTVTKKQAGHGTDPESATYPVLEFLGLLAAHIPAPYESLVFYYGVYSGETTIRPPPLHPRILSDNLLHAELAEPIPPMDVYAQDPHYPD